MKASSQYTTSETSLHSEQRASHDRTHTPMSIKHNPNTVKVSIITPTFNSAATVHDTLRSILEQTYTNYEVIVVDGGSTDGTELIVKGFAGSFGRRLIWISGRDKGLYDAMNKGISFASGDIVGVLNSDDFYAAPNILETMVKNIEGVGAVYGDLDFVDHDNTDKVVRKWSGSQYKKGAFMRGWHPAHPTFYARRRYFSDFGGFNIGLNVSADFELMFRFLEKNRIESRYIPQVMVKMRTGGESTGSLKKIIEGNRNVMKAFRLNGYKVPPFYLVKRWMPKILSVLSHRSRRHR